MTRDFTHVESSFVSPYYRWFCDLGYPTLDVVRFEDGEWSIIEMLNSPVVPSLTKFRYVLTGLRNVEISRGFIETWVKKLDPLRGEFHATENAKTDAIEKEHIKHAGEQEAEVERLSGIIAKNEGLRERLYRNGPAELDPDRIALNIAKQSPQIARDLGIKIHGVN